MRNKKTYVILFVALAVFFVVMFLVFGVSNIKKGEASTTLVVGDNTVWNYSKRHWLNLTSEKALSSLEWKEFNIYLDNKSLGKYNLWHDDKWYAFDKSKNAVPLDGNLLAYRSNVNVDVLDFTKEKIDDNSFVLKVLEDNDLSISSKFTTSYKVNFDFDSDNTKEDFYVISNAFPNDFNPEKIFSIVFMVKDDKIYYLYNDITENRAFNGCKPFINSILDVDQDGVYEMIVSCSKYSVGERIDMLYQYNLSEKAFKIVISNQ